MHKIICQIIVVFNGFVDFIIFFNHFLKLQLVDDSNALSTIPDFYPKPSAVKYSYSSNSLNDNGETLAAFLSKSY